MLVSTGKSALQPVSFPTAKPRVLLVSDNLDRLRLLATGLRQNEFEITTVSSLEELIAACRSSHDLVALDVSPTEIAPMLKQIRASVWHKTIPVLVDATRLNNELTLAGLLPEYRAMPCNRLEMLTLIQRNQDVNQDDPSSRRVL